MLKAVSVALAPRAAEQVTWIMGALVVLCHPTLDGYCGLGVPNSRLELSFAGDNSASSAGASSSSGSVTGLLSFYAVGGSETSSVDVATIAACRHVTAFAASKVV